MIKIAIASGKGGTGKTTLAVNLASFITNAGLDCNYDHIILVDLDVEEPDSGLFLNTKVVSSRDIYRYVPQWESEKCTFCRECKTLCKFNAIAELPETILVFPELCHSCYACSELCPAGALPMIAFKTGQLTNSICEDHAFVEARLNIGEPSSVPLIKSTKKYVEEHAATDVLVIYDCPPGNSCPVIESVKDADLVILVSESTPFGLHDLKLAVQTMQEIDLPFVVVINRYGIGDNSVEAYCEQNHIPVIGKIPYLKKAAELYSQGKLLYKYIPEIKEELGKIFFEINVQIRSQIN